jgi:hypothetical protein
MENIMRKILYYATAVAAVATVHGATNLSRGPYPIDGGFSLRERVYKVHRSDCTTEKTAAILEGVMGGGKASVVTNIAPLRKLVSWGCESNLAIDQLFEHTPNFIPNMETTKIIGYEHHVYLCNDLHFATLFLAKPGDQAIFTLTVLSKGGNEESVLPEVLGIRDSEARSETK